MNMKSFVSKFLSTTVLTIFFIVSFGRVSFAEVAIEGETEYIDLIQGVYLDKKFEDLPDKSVFKFENKKFKKYVDLVYDNDRKVIRFKPKRKGSVTIRFVNKKDPDLIIKQIKVTIQKSNLDKTAKEIKSLLGEIEGIEIKVLNNKVLVDGYILLAKDLNRIAMVLDSYGDARVKSIVRLSPLTRKKIAERIEAEIDNPNIYVTVINDFFVLEGSESWSGEAARAEEIAQAHVSDILTKFAVKNDRGGSLIRSVRKSGSPIINNIMALRAPPAQPKKMVQVVIHYVELAKSYSKGFNFAWTPTLSSNGSKIDINGGSLSSSNILSSLTATISNLLPRLNWAREHGHARILDTMNVTVETGEKGSVSSKKTIVVQQATPQGGVQALPITVSVSTDVTPTLDQASRDSIKLDLKVLIGEITNVSETSTNSVRTKITVRDKQSAAIGGLLRSSSGTAYNRVPAEEGQTLFKMRSSKDLTRAQNQFVIFVTPILKSNASQGMDRIKRKFRLDK